MFSTQALPIPVDNHLYFSITCFLFIRKIFRLRLNFSKIQLFARALSQGSDTDPSLYSMLSLSMRE